jgi:predicted dehydrogenase
VTTTEDSAGQPRRLRVLHVGCGPRGLIHLAAMHASGAIDVVGICDMNAERLAAAGEQFGIARRYSSIDEAIAHEQPDLVDIVTPPTIRLSIVEQALAAGAAAIHIEKPIALTPADARRLVELGNDRLISVNTQYQWMPHWQRFWEQLRAGALGEVRTLRASTRTNILEQGPHILDLALRAAACAGLPAPEWVLAGASGLEYFGETPVPADVSATIGLGDARMHLNAGPSAPAVLGETGFYYQQQIEIIGSRGRLWVSLNQGWELWSESGWERGPTSWPDDDMLAQPALFAELRDRVVSGAWQEFPTRIETAGRIADVMFACYASAERGERVMLPAVFPDDIIARLAERSGSPT